MAISRWNEISSIDMIIHEKESRVKHFYEIDVCPADVSMECSDNGDFSSVLSLYYADILVPTIENERIPVWCLSAEPGM